ncbi:MAG TPA: peptide chain release factor N(5)-glutamine methyltransferase [bacterium]|nr:peptide chain release factor N(5)-glutamine methyltransferase [bacterium]
MNIAELLASSSLRLSDSDSPRADAEILLAHVIQRPRSYFVAWPEAQVSASEAAAFAALLARRAAGEPVAYLLGSRGFYGLDLRVSPAVLIPRPETELLVEAALERLPKKPCRVADLGTGSGAIALALANELKIERPDAQVVAVDMSPEALAVAQENARNLNLAVDFRLGDWCGGLADEMFDLIVSNPPYIRADDEHLAQGDVRFEPTMALASGADGLNAIRAITACAPAHLKPGGWLLFEHGYDQAEAVATLLRAAGLVAVESLLDLQGHARVTLGRRSVE